MIPTGYLQRSALQKALTLVKKGITNRIIARDEERFWRGTQTLNDVLNAVDPLDAELYTFRELLDYKSADGRCRLEVNAAFHGQRPKKDGENIRRIIEKNFDLGLSHGPPGYGYTTQTTEVSKLLNPYKEKLFYGRRPEEIDEEELIEINNSIEQKRIQILSKVIEKYPTYKLKVILDEEAEMVVLGVHCYVNLRWGYGRIAAYFNNENNGI